MIDDTQTGIETKTITETRTENTIKTRRHEIPHQFKSHLITRRFHASARDRTDDVGRVQHRQLESFAI